MVKFFLIALVIWFIFFKLLRFKFIVFSGSNSRRFQQSKNVRSENEKKSFFKNQQSKNSDNGEYIDYEEVK